MENSEKDKRNKSPWVPKRERRGRKKKEKEKFSEVRKETLAESDKGSWYQQPSEEESSTAAIPSTSSSRKKLRKDTLETMPVELDKDLDPEDVMKISYSSRSFLPFSLPFHALFKRRRKKLAIVPEINIKGSYDK